MSIQTSTSLIQYHGNNSTATPYPVPFLFLENSHLKVIVTDNLGADHPLVLNAGFTVTGAGDSHGGSIRTTFAWPPDHNVTISREVPATQLTSYAENGDFPAASHEQALDKLTMLVQQNGRGKGLTLRLPETHADIPELQPQATSVVGFDGLSNPVTYDSAGLVAFLNLTQAVTDRPTKTFADAGARGAAVPEFLGQVGVQLSDQSLWISNAIAANAWQPVISGTSYNNDAFLIVPTSHSPTVNGSALLQTYLAAQSLRPGNQDLAAQNRATVVVPPGEYDLGSSELVLNTEFIDLIGMTTNRQAQYLHSVTATSSAGVIRQTANDVAIHNLTLKNNCSTAGTNSPSDSADYFASTNLSAAKLKNVEFLSAHDDGTVPWPMRIGVTYAGLYEDCVARGPAAFGGGPDGGVTSGSSVASGTFVRCQGGDNAFGGGTGSVLSGSCLECQGDQGSFGGQNGTIGATAALINCRKNDDALTHLTTLTAGARVTNFHDPSGVQYFPTYPINTGGIVQSVFDVYAHQYLYNNLIPINSSDPPQKSNGTEICTVSLTRKYSTSKIRLRFNGVISTTTATYTAATLFYGSQATAIHVTRAWILAGTPKDIFFEFIDSPPSGDPAPLTYTVNVGTSTGAYRMNCNSGGTITYGNAQCATLIAEEIRA